MKLLKSILVFVLFVASFSGNATHNRAGEITYRWLHGYTYEITLTTYTRDHQSSADRCKLTIFFGDGDSASVTRMNGLPAASDCGNTPFGEVIAPQIKKNIYKTTHTYSGPGKFKIWMFDRNRNMGVINIPNSVNQPFYLESVLNIDQFCGSTNSSPVLTQPPIDQGCVGVCFYHNAGAVDPEGDSLSYELTTCRGEDLSGFGNTIPGYSDPNIIGGGSYSIDPFDGTLSWCSPSMQGEFNAAFIIREWRKNCDGEWENIGYVLRDLQIDIGTCISTPPVIQNIMDTCVVAGSVITKTIVATDADADQVTISITGGPFSVPVNAASFTSIPGNPAKGIYSWNTSCSHVRSSPYWVYIKAKDNSSLELVGFKTFFITVVGPPPKNLTATPIGTSVKLVWGRTDCNNVGAGNKVIYYKVYRKNDCVPWVHTPCETGVPPSSGFTFIGNTTDINDTTFLDNNGGAGLSHGINYSYLVAAYYADGSYSYASNQVCVQLKRDIPIIINVDVQATSTTNGKTFVRWVKPLRSPGNLDTTILPGPYEFRLFYKQGAGGTFTQVNSVTKPSFSQLNQLGDTTFVHTGINTASEILYYRLDFYANNIFVGSAQMASSVFLSLSPADRKMNLSWTHSVPWVNTKYYIYRKDPSQSSFTLRDSTSAMNYTDSNNLANRATYCYRVVSRGAYSDTSILNPLLNTSQEACASPVDLTKPCAPHLDITSDCLTGFVKLVWNNPNHSCSDDVVKYNLYFKPTEDDELSLIDSIKKVSDTIYVFDGLSSIAGCYVVTAIDSSGNESVKGEANCVDNCPEFELPNIVTMNGDSVNDFFMAIKVRYIKEIDLKVYNRWGNIVSETKDPYFHWDGKSLQTGMFVSEGTYFYICDVYEIRVKGTTKRTLKSYLQVLRK